MRAACRLGGVWAAVTTIVAAVVFAAPGVAALRTHEASPPSFHQLVAVDGSSASNAWAVGNYHVGEVSRGLIEHWNGSSWKVQKSPAVSSGKVYLSGVAAISRDDAWVVGVTGDRGFIEHWDGHAWKLQVSARPPAGDRFSLSAITATSASSAWAVGGFTPGNSNHQQAFIEYWNGKSWSRQSSPSAGADNSYLGGVAATSIHNAWAVGQVVDPTNDVEAPLVEHWQNGKWSVQGSQTNDPSQDNYLEAVSAASPTVAFAAGGFDKGSAQESLIETLYLGSWHIQVSPNGPGGSSLHGVAATSAQNVWAVGGSGGPPEPLIEHFNGTSPWKIQATPKEAHGGGLNAVDAISTTNAWAVGYTSTAGGAVDTLIEHWSGSTWKVQPSPNG